MAYTTLPRATKEALEETVKSALRKRKVSALTKRLQFEVKSYRTWKSPFTYVSNMKLILVDNAYLDLINELLVAGDR